MSLDLYRAFGESLAPTRQRTLNIAKQPIGFTSNDYLGLSQHPALRAAAINAVQADGVGNRASRLAGGNTEQAEAVEAALAAFKGTEAALLFSSGFQMNSTALPALLDKTILSTTPLVLIDKLAHASLYHGLAAWGGTFHRFAHNDVNHLEKLLKTHHRGQPTWIITESIFSMDGDAAPLADLVQLKQHFNALLYVDEAHSTGVFGQGGRGLCHAHLPHIDVIAGTLSKAFGCFGGFIATSTMMKTLLINRCRGFIYTTALPPAVLGAVHEAIALMPTLDAQRRHVLALSHYFNHTMQSLGYKTFNTVSPIVPVYVGDDTTTLAWQATYAAKGISVSAIRPPTVPPNTARLRFSLSATHTQADVDAALVVLPMQEAA